MLLRIIHSVLRLPRITRGRGAEPTPTLAARGPATQPPYDENTCETEPRDGAVTVETHPDRAAALAFYDDSVTLLCVSRFFITATSRAASVADTGARSTHVEPTGEIAPLDLTLRDVRLCDRHGRTAVLSGMCVLLFSRAISVGRRLQGRDSVILLRSSRPGDHFERWCRCAQPP